MTPKKHKHWTFVLILLGLASAGFWWYSPSRELRATLRGHTGAVWAVAFAPDGLTLASGSADKTVKLWEPTTGKDLATLQGHAGDVYSVAFSPDGKTLASGSGDDSVKLWDVTTRRLRKTLKGHFAPVKSVAFSPDGKLLASGSADDTVKLWDPATGKERVNFPDLGQVQAVAFSGNGKTLGVAVVSSVKLINVWKAAKPEDMSANDNGLISLCISKDGKYMAAGSLEWRIVLWDLTTGQPPTTLKGHSFPVCSVAFSPDSKLLASGEWGGWVWMRPEAKIWNVSSGRQVVALRGHRSGVNAVAFSPYGETLATGSSDKTVKLWETPQVHEN